MKVPSRSRMPCLFLVAALTAACASFAQSNNLLQGDTSFESGSPGGRYRIGHLGGNGEFASQPMDQEQGVVFDRTTGVHGKASLRLEGKKGERPGLLFTAPAPVTRPCTASVFVRRGKIDAKVSLVVRDGETVVASADQTTSGSVWRRLTATVPAAGEDESFIPEIIVFVEAADGAPVWIDGVQLETGDRATTYGLAFPLTYGIRPSENDPPVATAPLRLVAHVHNDTEYIAVCRVVARVYPVILDASDPSPAVAEAEARIGMAPREGKDAVIELGRLDPGSYLATINRADGPPEEIAHLRLNVAPGPPLRIEARIGDDDPGSIHAAVRNMSDAKIEGRANAWIGPRPVLLESRAIEVGPRDTLELQLPLPDPAGGDAVRVRVETDAGPAELSVPLPAATASDEETGN